MQKKTSEWKGLLPYSPCYQISQASIFGAIFFWMGIQVYTHNGGYPFSQNREKWKVR